MSALTLHREIKKALVPQLRFSGFEGKWEEKTLFDISKEVSYGMNAAAKAFDGTHKYIRITDIDSESRKFIPNPLTSPEGDIDEKFRLKDNDLLFTRTGASVGKSYLYDSKDGALYYAGFLIKFNIVKADSYFVYSLTLKESYNKWVQVNSMRSGQPGLNAEEYRGFKLNIPSLPEQQKIASFLSAVDEKIQQLSRKKELLEQYKKGVMQQLFSGKLRFKDENGKDYADWEEKKLGEVCKLNPKSSLLPSSFIYIDLESVVNGQLLKETRIQLIEAPSRAQRLLSSEDILFQMVRPYQKNNLFFTKNGEYVASTGYAQLRAKESSMFLYQLIHTTDFVNKVIDRCTGTSYPAINSTDLSNIKISIPSFKEQQKIANFLSSIDTKIESTSQQLNQTQNFKKGLLQQMFV